MDMLNKLLDKNITEENATTVENQNTSEKATELQEELKKALQRLREIVMKDDVDTVLAGKLMVENYQLYCKEWFGVKVDERMQAAIAFGFPKVLESALMGSKRTAGDMIKLWNEGVVNPVDTEAFYPSSLTLDEGLFLENCLPEIVGYCGILLYVRETDLESIERLTQALTMNALVMADFLEGKVDNAKMFKLSSKQ